MSQRQGVMMARANPAVTLSIRIPLEIRNQLNELSDAIGRTKSFFPSDNFNGILYILFFKTTFLGGFPHFGD